MAGDRAKPESEAERVNREASEYWDRLAAKADSARDVPEQKQWRARPSDMTNNTPSAPGIDLDETDPLVIIYAAIQANTNGMKEAAAEAKATRREVTASNRLTEQQFESLKTSVLANTRAVQTFTARKEALANAKAAKYWWCAGGVVAGMLFLEAVWFFEQHLFG